VDIRTNEPPKSTAIVEIGGSFLFRFHILPLPQANRPGGNAVALTATAKPVFASTPDLSAEKAIQSGIRLAKPV
jgi:hypothetical protein